MNKNIDTSSFNGDFGEFIRNRREEMRLQDRKYSLRQVAVRVGLEPSYLSKIERGEQPPPSENKIRLLAEDLEVDIDVLLAMAGKVSSDLMDVIKNRPEIFSEFIRDLKNMPDHEVLKGVRDRSYVVSDDRNDRDDSVLGIVEVLSRYKFVDVFKTLFVSSTWLPNIAGPVRHLFLYACASSIKVEDYRGEKNIQRYEDFVELLEELIELAPHFPMLEDYIPNLDWGEFRYFIDEFNCRFLNESELPHTFEALNVFEIVHGALEDSYLKYESISPMEELKQVLLAHEDLISHIDTQKTSKEVGEIERGLIVVPNENYWRQVSEYLSNDSYVDNFYSSSLTDNTVIAGDVNVSDLSNFETMFMDGTAFPYSFISDGELVLPSNPRTHIPIMLERWKKKYDELELNEEEDKKFYSSLNVSLYKFIKWRTRSEEIHPLVRILDENEKPFDLVFSCVLLSNNAVDLFLLLDPLEAENDIEKISQNLEALEEHVSKNGLSIGLVLENKRIAFEKRQPTVRFHVVLTHLGLSFRSFALTEYMVDKVIFLEHFLLIYDECKDVEEFVLFRQFHSVTHGRMNPINSLPDSYGAFKHSNGVMIPGAVEPDFIMLDPQDGTNFRFKSLLNFWKKFPRISFYGDPRTWEVHDHTDGCVRIAARWGRDMALHRSIAESEVFITAPMYELPLDLMHISNFLMESLEDSLKKFVDLLTDMDFFKGDKKIKIIFFPKSVVAEKHPEIMKVVIDDQIYSSDFGIMDGSYGVRVIFDEDMVHEAFMEAGNRSAQNALFLLVLENLLKISRLQLDDVVRDSVVQTNEDNARYTFYEKRMPADFPDYVSPNIPTEYEYKFARKIVAQIALDINLSPGDYDVDSGKKMLNEIRENLIQKINDEVLKYDHKKSMVKLITWIDALSYQDFRKKSEIEQSVNHEVDFDRVDKFSAQQKEFVGANQCYRFLIEKFVQLQPSGDRVIGDSEFRIIIALINDFLWFSRSSDYLHYGIAPVSVRFDGDFLPQIVVDEKVREAQDSFADKMSVSVLGGAGSHFNLISDEPNFLNTLDEAFNKDLNFTFRNILEVCNMLSLWASHNGQEVKTYYSATLNEIKSVICKVLDDLTESQVELIIDFLTLHSDKVLSVFGSDELCDDLPVWEHSKRHYRFTIRPLIKIGDIFFWGAFSLRQTGIVWSHAVADGRLPISLSVPSINGCPPVSLNLSSIEKTIAAGKVQIEEHLVKDVGDLIRRHTKHIELDLFLHKKYKKSGYPDDLGDYDVLAYLEDFNIVLNIECKDYRQPFCLKDADTLRKKIFKGKGQSGLNSVDRVVNRDKYLSENLEKIFNDLKWPLSDRSNVEVISIYLTRQPSFWTHFPSFESVVQYLSLSSIEKFISDLRGE